MQTRSKPYADELVRFTFDQFANNCRHHIHKLWIMRILYLARNRLAPGNPIRDDLAFYWYTHGPFSEVIADILDNDKNIVRNYDESYSYSAQTRRTPAMSPDEYLQEAFHKMGPLVSRFRGGGTDMHYDDAPYRWYDIYTKFKDILNAYYQHIFERDHNPYVHTDVLELLDDTLGAIPLGRRFSEFRLTYNGFVRMVISLLKVQDIHSYRTQFYRLCRLSEDIWRVFAKGVRIVYHDPYYDDRLEQWKKDYADSLAALASVIRDSEKTLGIPEPDIPNDIIEIADTDIDPADVYTPAEAVREIDRIVNS